MGRVLLYGAYNCKNLMFERIFLLQIVFVAYKNCALEGVPALRMYAGDIKILNSFTWRIITYGKEERVLNCSQ